VPPSRIVIDAGCVKHYSSESSNLTA